MKHVILTRYNIGLYSLPDADAWMRDRNKLFSKTCASVFDQVGNPPFDWFIYFDERTPDGVMWDLCPFPQTYPIKGDPRSFVPSELTITTRLDNDDLLRPNAIQAIQAEAQKWHDEKPRPLNLRDFVVDIGYEKLDVATGVMHPSHRKRANSPFLSLVSRKKNCYCRPHTFMPDDFPSTKIDQILATMVIHKGNQANDLKS
jgi:hypothetical protein